MIRQLGNVYLISHLPLLHTYVIYYKSSKQTNSLSRLRDIFESSTYALTTHVLFLERLYLLNWKKILPSKLCQGDSSSFDKCHSFPTAFQYDRTNVGITRDFMKACMIRKLTINRHHRKHLHQQTCAACSWTTN